MIIFSETMEFEVEDVQQGWRSEIREGVGSWAIVEPSEQVYFEYGEDVDFAFLISSMNDDGELKLYLLQGDPDVGDRMVFASEP
ncbi:hypothetical protein LX16_3264 [Stackebrandtia albiflava]|uniref:Uncharacterized protein n=2 Tax=Stackebrandtia albiflava TaxID=406432 RepID=A0A562V3S2_9ACTN|nr:hypothetical protein LX16_3264 [Stackebrandtia albiflava]